MTKRLVRRATLALGVALALTLALVLATPRRVEADLETTFPPGTPNEWHRDFAERVPHLRGLMPSPSPSPSPEKAPSPSPSPAAGGTQERKKEEAKKEPLLKTETRVQPELGSGPVNQPFYFAGVLTTDLPIHCGWVKRQGELGPRTYPPAVTDDLYWMAQVSFLRRLLHPAMVGEAETYWHLIQLGDCARECAKGAKSERFLENLANAVTAGVPELPKDGPDIPDGADDPEQKMLRHLVRDDLADGEPYSLDPTYASRVLSLGEPAYAAVEAAARSSHSLLRRAAVVLLGNYPHPEALEMLRQLSKDGDATVRTRALFSLFKKKDEKTVPDLLAMLAGDDARGRPLAAYGLGLIGTKECVEPLCSAIDKNKEDWDTIVACTVALGRCGSLNKEAALPVLKKLEESLRNPAGARFVEKTDLPRPQADNPDRGEVMNRMLLELATISLARLGDKDGLAKANAIVQGKYEDSKNPIGWANSSGPQRADQCESMKWLCPSSHWALIEMWAARPAAETAGYLQQAVMNEKLNERLRCIALKAESLSKDKKFLQVALGLESPGVRAIALRELANVDEKLGQKAAEGVLAQFSSGAGMSKLNPKGDTSVVVALEILYKLKKLKVDSFKPVIMQALKEYTYEKPDVTAEGLKPFRFSPPILETCAWMLGNLGDKSAFALLKSLATTTTAASARPEAIRALGHVPGEPSLTLLGTLLDDEDGFVRYNAFIALKMLTGKDDFCDWIYGSKEDRKEVTAKWKELVKKGGK